MKGTFRINRKLHFGDFKKCIDSASLDIINSNLPEILRKQGKGWGSSTTKKEVSAILNLSKVSFKDDLTIFDIGANVGLYTEALLEQFPNAHIFAFEPSEKAFLSLTSKFQSHSRVELINSAVGSKSGSTILYSDESGSGMSSLTKRRLDHFGLNFSFEEKVNVVTLDEWCKSNSIWPSIIKMDVEGHELDVLNSGLNAIKRARVIQFEFGGCNIDTRTYFQDFWYLFKEHNFEIWRITPTELEHIQNYSEYDECFTTTNYIAVRTTI
jgi:FkbM family methyltransferase